MPEVMDWPEGEALAESYVVVGRALEHLRSGGLVGLQAESASWLAAAALAPGALEALAEVGGGDAAPTFLLGYAEEVFDWLPFFRGAGVRLVRRFWPGPLTLLSGAGMRQGIFAALSEILGERVAELTLHEGQQVAVCLPQHPAARMIAQRLGGPLLAVASPFETPQKLAEALGDRLHLIVESGWAHLPGPNTVVEVLGRNWQLKRAGAISASEIDDAALCRILFLCTGNTCRSPLAEGLCAKLLAAKLGCSPAELANHGFLVQSAGLAAMMGREATPEAVLVAQEHGADLSRHGSRPLTMEMLLGADCPFAMTQSHLRLLEGVRGVTLRLLAPDGEDVADPIGGTPEDYRDCAMRIRASLEELLPELLEC